MSEEQIKSILNKLWKIGENIRYGRKFTTKDRKEIGKSLFKIHDDLANIFMNKLKILKKGD
jgi:hypothetical protein